MAKSPYARAPIAKVDEIVRLAEMRLEAQLTLGIAADQRAMTLASFLAALDAAVIAAWATLSAQTHMGWTFGLMTAGFGAATLMASHSAQPITWDVPGGKPSDWLADIDEGDDLENGRAAMAEHYDDMITQNDIRLASNANWVRLAFVVIVATLLLSAITAGLRV